LSYQGIFNSHVEFHNRHWIPAVSKASQFLLHVENCTYRNTAGHIHQQQSSPESVALLIGQGRRQKETSIMEEQAPILIDIGEREQHHPLQFIRAAYLVPNNLRIQEHILIPCMASKQPYHSFPHDSMRDHFAIDLRASSCARKTRFIVLWAKPSVNDRRCL
jgi:hypothetical protein